MRFNFYHYFDHYHLQVLTDEQKLEIAKRKATEDLAKKLVDKAEFKVDAHGNVEGIIDLTEGI